MCRVGPGSRVNRTYAIYWVPSCSTLDAGYQSTINQYLTDVSDDSGKPCNVYFTQPQ